MPIVEVTDVRTTCRLVEVPATCPGTTAIPCGADLTEPGSLLVSSLSDVGHLGRLASSAEVRTGKDNRGVVVDYEYDVPLAFNSIPSFTVYCQRCGETLAGGRIETK
jgi:hypothetical protein